MDRNTSKIPRASESSGLGFELNEEGKILWADESQVGALSSMLRRAVGQEKLS